jgi:thiamine transport system substrate-binding protein
MIARARPGALALKLFPFCLAIFAFAASLIYLVRDQSFAQAQGAVRVLSNSAFLSAWGPGPELAKRFTEQTGIAIEFLDAGDAALLLKKLELFPSDVVVGFDELNLGQARAAGHWRGDFVAYDWAPMAFIYREGELAPPSSLQDLLAPRFAGTIALEDPRTSTPGLQFFFWVLDELGIDEGFAYLEKLKPNVQSVGATWSQAYGSFTKKKSKLAFSYLTSPVYHWSEEKNRGYQPALFPAGHPTQTEYAAIAEACGNCEGAEKFLRFLLEPAAQAIVMNKNFMFPVAISAAQGTDFELLLDKQPVSRAWRNLPALLEHREELFERWRRLGL